MFHDPKSAFYVPMTMSHLTREELEHLSKLIALDLTPQEQEHLLPQLEHIITFVSQLQEYPVAEEDGDEESPVSGPHATIPEVDFPQHFFDNIQHPEHQHRLQIRTRLTRE